MKLSQLLRALLPIFTLAAFTANAAADWPQFRGPGGNAVAAAGGLPTQWSDAQNVAWKTELPGFGGSSPIVVGQRIFLTSYSGYGLDDEKPGDESRLVRRLLCLDRGTGQVLWRRDVPAAQPEASYIDFMPRHGYATNTPVADDERVYAFFGKSGVHAYSHDGQPLWQADVGDGFHYWGSAGSLVLDGPRLLVNATLESQSLVALNKETGQPLWKTTGQSSPHAPREESSTGLRPAERDGYITTGLISSWSTPVRVPLPDGGHELVLSVRSKLVGVNAETGEKLWTCRTDQSYGSPCPAVHEGRLYAFAARPSRVLAIRPGGRGDVTQTHVDWEATGIGPGITSPVIVDGHLYAVDEQGITGCVRLSDGQVLYRQRLADGATFYASPVAGDCKLYAVSRDRGTFVLAIGPQFRQLAHNRFATDDSIFNATPAIHDGQLLIRSNRCLYCVGGPNQ